MHSCSRCRRAWLSASPGLAARLAAILLVLASSRVSADLTNLEIPPAAAPSRDAVRIPATHAAALGELDLRSSEQLNYGAYIWMPAGGADRLALRTAGIAFESIPDAFTIRLGELSFDPLVALPELPAGLDAVRPNAADLHLIQLRGPSRSSWVRSLEDAGLRIVQYIHPFTYVVWGRPETLLHATAKAPFVRWTGPFAPAYRLLPRVRALSAASFAVRILVYRGADADLVMSELAGLGGTDVQTIELDNVLRQVVLQLPGAQMSAAARIPGVYSVKLVPTDGGSRGEMSCQVNANNVDGSNMAFPGYPAWLAGIGLDGSGVIIANVDEGIQDDHIDLFARMWPCVGVTCGGGLLSNHGTHTAGIMAADGTSGLTDRGFLRGLGVAPGAMLLEQVYYPHFTTAGGMLLLMGDSAINGASISGNSWGPAGTPLGYDDDTRQVDAGVRDANDATAGNQPLSYVLSIMNGYGGTSTQGTPDEAKNIFTVGSTKMQNGGGAQLAAINDLSTNTAHGPALDGRLIPHMVAPGCSVDSTVPFSDYAVNGWCGTSAASPQVSGGVALFIQYYRDHLGSAVDPSPALIRAAFLPVAHSLAGNLDADGGTMGHPFDSKQGWGRLDVEAVVAPPLPVQYFDDPMTFDESGEQWVQAVSAADPNQPIRIMLAWTDAPGHGLGGSTPAWNNDLDLSAKANGLTYWGNDFGPAGWSIPSVTPDDRNNTEGIFIGPTATGQCVIRVRATNISSDGIPSVGDGTDQDFALVCYNCVIEPDYNLTVDPFRDTVCIPGPGVFNISVGEVLGYSDPVFFSTTGEPPGTIVNFSQNPVIPPGTTVLTIDNTAAASLGDHSIDIVATSSISRTARIVLNVSNDRPGSFMLNYPPNGAIEVPPRPVFSWTPATQASAYEIEVASDPGFFNIVESAIVKLPGYTPPGDLAHDTMYFWRVLALNGCQPGEYLPTFSFKTVKLIDHFTEQFEGDYDLGNLSILFAPDGSGSYYNACVEPIAALPVDPAAATPLAVADDSFVEVFLAGGETVSLYGAAYASVFVGDNGYLTLLGGDVDYDETLGEHFNQPRLSVLYDDFNPSAGGIVSSQQLADRLVVTYENVPEWIANGSNTFQVEWFFSGDIRFSYLDLTSSDGIVGLSEGLGLPPTFIESDLSMMTVCGGCATGPGDLVDADGVNGKDITAFVECYLGGDPTGPVCACADMAPPFGVYSEDDIAAFVDCLIGMGCPP